MVNKNDLNFAYYYDEFGQLKEVIIITENPINRGYRRNKENLNSKLKIKSFTPKQVYKEVGIKLGRDTYLMPPHRNIIENYFKHKIESHFRKKELGMFKYLLNDVRKNKTYLRIKSYLTTSK